MEIASIPSEDIEPFCAMIIGRLWKRISHEIDNGESYMQDYRLRTLCNSLWHAVAGLRKVIAAISNNGDYDHPGPVHASLAISNEIRAIEKMLVNVNIKHMDGLMFSTKELDDAVTEEIKWQAMIKNSEKS